MIGEMRKRGAPVLRACYDAPTDTWHAQEGTHRLRAAKHLGLVPVLVAVRWRKGPEARRRARFAADRNAHTFTLETP